MKNQQARQARLGAAPRLGPAFLLLGAALLLFSTSAAASVGTTPLWSSPNPPSAELQRLAAAAAMPPVAPPLPSPPVQAANAAEPSPPAQAAGAAQPAAPTSELAQVAKCQDLIDGLFSNCAVSMDRMSMSYSRGSERLPTAEEQAGALQGLKQAGLPPARRAPALQCSMLSGAGLRVESTDGWCAPGFAPRHTDRRCCGAVEDWVLSPCPCSEDLKHQLTAWLVDLAGVDFAVSAVVPCCRRCCCRRRLCGQERACLASLARELALEARQHPAARACSLCRVRASS